MHRSRQRASLANVVTKRCWPTQTQVRSEARACVKRCHFGQNELLRPAAGFSTGKETTLVLQTTTRKKCESVSTRYSAGKSCDNKNSPWCHLTTRTVVAKVTAQRQLLDLFNTHHKINRFLVCSVTSRDTNYICVSDLVLLFWNDDFC